MFRSKRTGRALIAALAFLTLASACTSGSPTTSSSAGGGAAAPIKVWIEEDLPERVAATKKIAEAYTAKTGAAVDLISISEDEFNQLLTSSAAAGDLPDVIGGVSLPQVRTMSANQLLDTAATAEVLNTLGAGTFAESGLALTKDGDTQLAIPSESWTQLLLYRKDLFDKAGLAAPATYADITAAAKALDSSEVAGFVGANIAGDAFTEQTFEHVALGNNCQLVDNAGTVTLDSAECVESFGFYGDLVKNYSVPGAQDVDTVRAQYFSGKAAMAIWSTFILDELAGLRNDAKPNCSECKSDPTWLAKNTGIVTAISGPKGSAPAVFGEVTSWVIPAEAEAAGAKAFIEFMMTDGYLDWIAIAPEGKVPVRAGTAEEATKFSDGWAALEVGVDAKAPLADFYGPEVIEALTTGPAKLARWAIPQGQGNLLGAVQGENPVAAAVNKVTSGADAAAEAKTAAEAVRQIQESIK